MTDLTNIIEAIIFASGEEVPVKYIVEKLGHSLKEVNASINELKEKYPENSGIQLLVFNGKVQFASNPAYKEQISQVLVPIKEKEFTKTILECAALIAYKQPVTKPELEEIRQVSCDYAIHTLLELGMIEPCGRKDAIGKPILYRTTDNFLKRFKLNSIEELPDYDDLMSQIAELKQQQFGDDDSNYLYKKDVYVEEGEEGEEGAENPENVGEEPKKPSRRKRSNGGATITEDGFEIPDFISDDDDIIKID